MICIIEDVLRNFLKKGKSLEVVQGYLKEKYHVNIDKESLLQRLKLMKLNTKVKA